MVVKKKDNRKRLFGKILLHLLCMSALGGLVYTSLYLKSMNNRLQAEITELKTQRAELEASNVSFLEKTTQLQREVTDLQNRLNQAENSLAEQAFQEQQEAIVQMDSLLPGDIVTLEQIGEIGNYFQMYEITIGDEIYQRINGKSYRENPNVALSDLRYLKMLHYNFEHQIQVGEMIVNQSVCEDVLAIFQQLFEAEYEIQSMYLIDNYWTGDGNSTDTASIEVNNTSCFNYREVTGGGNLSNHAYGCAIDINPQQNPYVWFENGQKCWTHSNASDFIENRDRGDAHMIVQGDFCYNLFVQYGFHWGGNWSNPIDYQHFEKQ